MKNIPLISGVAIIALIAGYLIGKIGQDFQITITWKEPLIVTAILVIVFISGTRIKNEKEETRIS